MQRSTAVVLCATAAALSMLAAGCGSSPAGHVAQLGAATTPTQRSTSSGSALAYAGCMRSHGVSSFPDPDGTGEIPKAQVVSARKANPARFDAANAACRHLLPSGGNGETPAQLAADWSQFRAFARCMRRHGVANFPDPTNRSATDRRPSFDIAAAGLDPSSPQLRAKAQQCAAPLHRAGLPADASLIPSARHG